MNIGVVLVTHCELGAEMLVALRSIIPNASDFHAVSVSTDQTVEQMRKAISAKLGEANNGHGVLILTDMFGGTPSNIALSFLAEQNVEVVTGLNLPMLIKLATLKNEKSLEDLASFIKEYGQRNISVASKLVSEGEK